MYQRLVYLEHINFLLYFYRYINVMNDLYLFRVVTERQEIFNPCRSYHYMRVRLTVGLGLNSRHICNLYHNLNTPTVLCIGIDWSVQTVQAQTRVSNQALHKVVRIFTVVIKETYVVLAVYRVCVELSSSLKGGII